MFPPQTSRIRSLFSRIPSESIKVNQGSIYIAAREMGSDLGSGSGKGGGGGRRSMATQGTDSSKLPAKAPKEKEDKLSLFKGKRFPDFETVYRKRGTGGRSSYSGITATIFNGSSFVARNVIARLGKTGTQMVIAYRGSRYEEEKMRPAADLGQIFFSHYNLKDDKSLYEAMRYSNVVVNCIGKELETSNFTFDQVHVDGPRRMARIARECGVKKFIHLSSMNVSPNPEPQCLKNGSQFLRSKYYGELAVMEEFPGATIFRPADVLGEQDEFLNHFTEFGRCRFTKKLPIWDYYDGVEKQPVWIKDLVSGIENAISDDSSSGKIYQAVGPYRYNFYDLIEYIRACAGQGQKYDECEITNLRWDFLLQLGIWVTNKTQKYPFMTWERCERDLHSDIIDPNLPTLTDLGVELTPLEIHIQTLAHYRPREHRVEIPYESAMRIEAPRKLNVEVA